MTRKDLKNTRRLKRFAPVLVAGATIAGSAGAVAGFTALVHDENYSAVFKIDTITQDAEGLTATLAKVPSPDPDPDTCMSNYTKGDTFIIQNSALEVLAGCELDNVVLNADGEMVINVKGCFNNTEDQACKKSYSCEPADWADASSDDKLFILNLKGTEAYAGDCKSAPEERVETIFVGNVDINDTVRFITTKGGSIRINRLFRVSSSSDAHRFTFSATTTSGS